MSFIDKIRYAGYTTGESLTYDGEGSSVHQVYIGEDPNIGRHKIVNRERYINFLIPIAFECLGCPKLDRDECELTKFHRDRINAFSDDEIVEATNSDGTKIPDYFQAKTVAACTVLGRGALINPREKTIEPMFAPVDRVVFNVVYDAMDARSTSVYGASEQ